MARAYDFIDGVETDVAPTVSNDFISVPTLTGNAGKVIAVKSDETGFEFQSTNNGIISSVTKPADATLSAAEFDGIVYLDATSAVVAITLPAANTVTGKICRPKVINATNACTLVGTIDGVSGYEFSGVNDKCAIYSDGTNFYFV